MFCDLWNALTMAGLALRRRGFVEKYEAAVHRLFQRMTCGASHFLVTSFKRESGLGVIEEGRPPLVAVVACGTVLASFAELVGMGIFVAFAAFYGRLRKLDMDHREFKIRCFVAIGAGNRTMRSKQRKACLIMIEFG